MVTTQKFRFEISKCRQCGQPAVSLLDGYHGRALDAAWYVLKDIFGKSFLYLYAAQCHDHGNGSTIWHIALSEEAKNEYNKRIRNYMPLSGRDFAARQEVGDDGRVIVGEVEGQAIVKKRRHHAHATGVGGDNRTRHGNLETNSARPEHRAGAAPGDDVGTGETEQEDKEFQAFLDHLDGERARLSASQGKLFQQE